jgi:hypothetical protein
VKNDEAAPQSRPATIGFSSRVARAAARKNRRPCMHVLIELDARPRVYIAADSMEDQEQLLQWARVDRRVSAALRELGIAA